MLQPEPRTIAIVHSMVPPDAPVDEQDTLVVAAMVKEILENAGYGAVCLPFAPCAEDRLRAMKPAGIFNLVESVDGKVCGAYEAAFALERLHIPFCGLGGETMRTTTDKVLTKQILAGNGLLTARMLDEKSIARVRTLDRPCILKPRHEDSSVGIFADSVTADAAGLRALLAERKRRFGGEWFAEEFIEGREFHLSLLNGGVLPPAEILFDAMPEGLPHILDYAAKWSGGNPAPYKAAWRFRPRAEEPALFDRFEDIARRCWDIFGLRGWARIDLRLDRAGNPYILEVNGNPDLSLDCIFMSAARKVGFLPEDVILALIGDFDRDRP